MTVFNLIDTAFASLAVFTFAYVVVGIASETLRLVPRPVTAPVKPAVEPVVNEPAPLPVVPPVIKPVAPAKPAKPTLSGLIREAATSAPRKRPDELPSTIRGVRQYIRENALQERVKFTTGKTVSKCTLAELLEALATA